MFTDRFIQIPIVTYSTKAADMGIEQDYQETIMKINPFEISHYYPQPEDGKEAVSIIFKNGERTLCYLSLIDFEKLLNKTNL